MSFDGDAVERGGADVRVGVRVAIGWKTMDQFEHFEHFELVKQVVKWKVCDDHYLRNERSSFRIFFFSFVKFP